MSTEYDIRCVEHDDRWPNSYASGIRHYQIPAAFDVIDHRAAVVELGSLEIDWEVNPWHLPGLYGLAEFFEKHADCALTVWDEYGREAKRGPAA